MTLNEYQESASRTAQYPLFVGKVYCALKLNGEAGEVAELIGKRIRGDDTPGYDILVAKELGDCLWYISQLAKEFNYSLEEIAEMNLQKLADRAARGKIKGSGDER